MPDWVRWMNEVRVSALPRCSLPPARLDARPVAAWPMKVCSARSPSFPYSPYPTLSQQSPLEAATRFASRRMLRRYIVAQKLVEAEKSGFKGAGKVCLLGTVDGV